MSLAEKELAKAIEIIFSRSPSSQKIVMIVHSLGGIILRHFFDTNKNIYSNTLTSRDIKNRISGIALLASPNHGIAISESCFKSFRKKFNDNIENPTKSYDSFSRRIKKSIFEILDLNSFIENQMKSNTILELFSGSEIIKRLNKNISTCGLMCANI
ncbi:MAG: hypothetical protein HeimC3_01750 [Candidatus Heimdallarchaeota archaeon LC_3]|nr:MAG: hypothetical protein HeimC3_01750 [Candidatus Heimdallarchaeota archaeon LC_3]